MSGLTPVQNFSAAAVINEYSKMLPNLTPEKERLLAESWEAILKGGSGCGSLRLINRRDMVQRNMDQCTQNVMAD
jgi:hypothetical protein